MLAVAGGKGGSGKTTTAVGLARALAEPDRRPLLVDADVDMPDVHVVTGTPLSPGLTDHCGDAPLETVVHRAPRFDGLDVVPAGEDGDEAPAASLRGLDDRFDCVVVDTPAGGARDVAVPLRVATAVILVAGPTRRSLTDAAKTAAMARRLGTDVLGLVLTRDRSEVDPRPLVECPLLGRVPPASDPLTDHRVARAYEAVARSVRHRIGRDLG